MAPSPTVRRLLKETSELSANSKNPNPAFHAAPVSDTDLHEWHFTLLGPPSPSPYAGGLYHGRISLPPTYPLKPPNFRFLTPSGRFEVNREICLSISGFHEETWMPAWGVRTALTALRSFMAESGTAGQVGGLEAPKEVRERLARESRSWRCKECGGGSGRTNEEIMKEWWEVCAQTGVAVGEDVGLEGLPEGMSLVAKIPGVKGKEKEIEGSQTTSQQTQGRIEAESQRRDVDGESRQHQEQQRTSLRSALSEETSQFSTQSQSVVRLASASPNPEIPYTPSFQMPPSLDTDSSSRQSSSVTANRSSGHHDHSQCQHHDTLNDSNSLRTPITTSTPKTTNTQTTILPHQQQRSQHSTQFSQQPPSYSQSQTQPRHQPTSHTRASPRQINNDQQTIITIDRAIYIVFLALCLMILKKIFYPAGNGTDWEDYTLVKE